MLKSDKDRTKLEVFSSVAETFSFYKNNFLLLTKITLAVAVFVGLLQFIQTDYFNGDSTIISSIAWAYAIMALLYVSLDKKLKSNKLSFIYTSVSGYFLQYLVVSLVLILSTVPLIGTSLTFVLLIPIYQINIWLGLMLVAITIILPFFLYSRLILALPAVMDRRISSFSALKYSWKISKGNRFRIIAVLLILTIGIIVIVTIISALVGLSQFLNQNRLFQSLLYVIESVVFVPILISSTSVIYKRLS